MPCAVGIAELAMFPAYHLRLEANWSIRGCVRVDGGNIVTI